VLSALSGKGDAIYSDRMNHASIIDGCRLSRADAFVYAYRDTQNLEAELQSRPHGGSALIISDGVFSMEGHLAPVPKLLAIARATGALLVIDDSHATGVVGPDGAGSASYFGIATDNLLTTGTFSKALGGAPGGFVAGARDAIAGLRAQARPFIFTTGMSVADAAASLEALRQLRDHPEHLERLWSNTSSFRSLLRGHGFEIEDSPSPITPLLVGDSERARTIHARLLELGVFVPAMTFPIVDRNDARLRAQPSAALSPEQIKDAADAIAQAFSECKA
jgi:glycine C-acetyltransferase